MLGAAAIGAVFNSGWSSAIFSFQVLCRAKLTRLQQHVRCCYESHVDLMVSSLENNTKNPKNLQSILELIVFETGFFFFVSLSYPSFFSFFFFFLKICMVKQAQEKKQNVPVMEGISVEDHESWK